MNQNKIIIGLTGAAGAGKDTAADFIARHNFTKIAFADTLREEIAHAWGIAPQLLTERAQKEIPQVPLEINRCQDVRFVQFALTLVAGDCQAEWYAEGNLPRSPRWIMQHWGDYRRHLFGTDYFISAIAQRIAKIDTHIIVTDCRFDNEALYLSARHNAQIWRIQRPNLAAVSAHKSENGIHPQWIDREIYNHSSINALHENLADALIQVTFQAKAACANY